MPKYNPDTSHWDEEDESSPRWREETSATIELEAYLHQDGYQEDRRWTVHFGRFFEDETLTALYAIEDQNKGNYWRPGNFKRDAVDFVDVPLRVRRRVAAALNRDLDEITPNQRLVEPEVEP